MLILILMFIFILFNNKIKDFFHLHGQDKASERLFRIFFRNIVKSFSSSFPLQVWLCFVIKQVAENSDCSWFAKFFKIQRVLIIAGNMLFGIHVLVWIPHLIYFYYLLLRTVPKRRTQRKYPIFINCLK